MMNGGDLDGDVYLAIWDAEILNHITPDKMHPPAEYDKTKYEKEI